MAPPHHHYPQGGSTRIYVDENGYPVSASQQPPDGSGMPTDTDVLLWVHARWPDRTDITSRAMKLAEEAGEVMGACVRLGESRGQVEHLAKELAQLVMCAKGLAAAAEFDLDEWVAAEWVEMQTRQWPGVTVQQKTALGSES